MIEVELATPFRSILKSRGRQPAVKDQPKQVSTISRLDTPTKCAYAKRFQAPTPRSQNYSAKASLT